jgi:hypothetical protein
VTILDSESHVLRSLIVEDAYESAVRVPPEYESLSALYPTLYVDSRNPAGPYVCRVAATVQQTFSYRHRRTPCMGVGLRHHDRARLPALTKPWSVAIAVVREEAGSLT